MAEGKVTKSHYILEQIMGSNIKPSLDSAGPNSMFYELNLFYSGFVESLKKQEIFIILPETIDKFRNTLKGDVPYFISLAKLIRGKFPEKTQNSEKDLQRLIEDNGAEIGVDQSSTIYDVYKKEICKIDGYDNHSKRYSAKSDSFAYKMCLNTHSAINYLNSSVIEVINQNLASEKNVAVKLQKKAYTHRSRITQIEFNPVLDPLLVGKPFSFYMICETSGLSCQSKFNVDYSLGDIGKDSIFVVSSFEEWYSPILIKIVHDKSRKAVSVSDQIVDRINKIFPDRMLTSQDYKNEFKAYLH